MSKSVELREKRLNIFEQQKEITDLAEAEGRDLSAEESQKWDRLEAEDRDLEARIARIEALDEREAALSRPSTTAIKPEPSDAERSEEQKVAYRAAFDRFLRFGMEELDPEERKVLRTGVDTEVRAQSVGTGSAGGYLVPIEFQEEISEAEKAYGGVRSICRVVATGDGRDVQWPTEDETGNTGELLAENTAAAALDVTVGQVTLKNYKYSSKLVKVSIELMQDSAFDLNAHLAGVLGTRIGRIVNTHATTGTGTAQPKGVVTEASLGKTAASTTAITFDELLDLEHSVDPLYRQSSQAAWMFNDGTLKAVKKLKDAEGRYLWQPAMPVAGQPASLDNFPYVINQDMASIATGNKAVLFGDFSKFVLREIAGYTLVRMNERFIDSGQVAFLAFARRDARGIHAESTNGAIKYLALA